LQEATFWFFKMGLIVEFATIHQRPIAAALAQRQEVA